MTILDMQKHVEKQLLELNSALRLGADIVLPIGTEVRLCSDGLHTAPFTSATIENYSILKGVYIMAGILIGLSHYAISQKAIEEVTAIPESLDDWRNLPSWEDIPNTLIK